jgi:uncharacterized protein YbbK (DUF523 family)
MKNLVSACLLGDKVRYNGSDASCECNLLEQWKAEGRIIPFCPEVAGGLPVPQPAAEIMGRDGLAVIDGGGRVFDRSGHDVTACFIDGATKALEAPGRTGLNWLYSKRGVRHVAVHTFTMGIFLERAKMDKELRPPYWREMVYVF